MKKLFYLFVGMLIMTVHSCHQNPSERYQRYLEDVADTTFEYITPKEDSLNADGELIVPEEEVGSGWADDDGLVAVPDSERASCQYECQQSRGGEGYERQRF